MDAFNFSQSMYLYNKPYAILPFHEILFETQFQTTRKEAADFLFS